MAVTLKKNSAISIHEEIECRLKKGNLCYYSSPNTLSFRVLSRNLKNKIYKIMILTVGLYDCERWSITLRGNAGKNYSKSGF